MPDEIMPRTYIGDGVYASFDGYQVWLETHRDFFKERIAIEAGTFEQLLNYSKQHPTYRELITRMAARISRDERNKDANQVD